MGWGDSDVGWGGNLTSGGGGGGGGERPIVTNFLPTKDTPIYGATPLSFDVTFSGAVTLAAIVVYVDYIDTGAREVVYTAERGFSTNFRPSGDFLGSELSTISGGIHFLLRRSAGWYLSPTIRVEGASDAGGSIVEVP